jgi:hypothetical protein
MENITIAPQERKSLIIEMKRSPVEGSGCTSRCSPSTGSRPPRSLASDTPPRAAPLGLPLEEAAPRPACDFLGDAVRVDVGGVQEVASGLEKPANDLSRGLLVGLLSEGHVPKAQLRDHQPRIRVRDDGHGFDTGRPPQGLGLEYMRRRAGEVDADLDVISTPGRGTLVQVRFRKRQNTANP